MKEGWIEDKFYACINKADCYRILNDSENELKSLFQSLEFSKSPRPECCSRIGYNFHRKREFSHAVFWYDLATQLKPDPNQWSFSYPAYSTWYPHLQMCVCYYNLGNMQKAYEHNEKARKYRPEDQAILTNKSLLEKRLGLEPAKKEE